MQVSPRGPRENWRGPPHHKPPSSPNPHTAKGVLSVTGSHLTHSATCDRNQRVSIVRKGGQPPETKAQSVPSKRTPGPQGR